MSEPESTQGSADQASWRPQASSQLGYEIQVNERIADQIAANPQMSDDEARDVAKQAYAAVSSANIASPSSARFWVRWLLIVGVVLVVVAVIVALAAGFSVDMFVDPSSAGGTVAFMCGLIGVLMVVMAVVLKIAYTVSDRRHEGDFADHAVALKNEARGR